MHKCINRRTRKWAERSRKCQAPRRQSSPALTAQRTSPLRGTILTPPLAPLGVREGCARGRWYLGCIRGLDGAKSRLRSLPDSAICKRMVDARRVNTGVRILRERGKAGNCTVCAIRTLLRVVWGRTRSGRSYGALPETLKIEALRAFRGFPAGLTEGLRVFFRASSCKLVVHDGA